jgi:hypothetical protein
MSEQRRPEQPTPTAAELAAKQAEDTGPYTTVPEEVREFLDEAEDVSISGFDDDTPTNPFHRTEPLILPIEIDEGIDPTAFDEEDTTSNSTQQTVPPQNSDIATPGAAIVHKHPRAAPPTSPPPGAAILRKK